MWFTRCWKDFRSSTRRLESTTIGRPKGQRDFTPIVYAIRPATLHCRMARLIRTFWLNVPERLVTTWIASTPSTRLLQQRPSAQPALTSPLTSRPTLTRRYLLMRARPWHSSQQAVSAVLLAERNISADARLKGWQEYIAMNRRTRVLNSYEWRRNTKALRLRLRQDIYIRSVLKKPVLTHIRLFSGHTQLGHRR